MSAKKPWLASYGTMRSSLEYPDRSITDCLFDNINKYLDKTAIEYYGSLITYRDLKERIKSCAKSLHYIGVGKGDIVTICTPNVPQGIIMFYACNYIGAIANMTHPLSSSNEIEFYLNDTKSKVILTLDMFYDKVSKATANSSVEKIIVANVSEDMPYMMTSLYKMTKGRKIETIPKLENVIPWKTFMGYSKLVEKNVHQNLKGKDTAVILYSGGTTGNSKGVLLSNLNFNAGCLQALERVDPKDGIDHVILAILPIFHSFGLSVSINTPLNRGWKVVLVPDFKASKYAELVKKYKPTFIIGVPTLFEVFLKNKVFNSSTSLQNIRIVISGGDKMNESLKRRVNEYLVEKGSIAKVQEGYGLTECTGAACLNSERNLKPDSIGFPFPDTLMKIVYTGTMNETPYGVEGEICISGPTVMTGYLNNTKETYSVLKKHSDGNVWLHTGDLGYMDKDGWLYYKARLKRMIVTSGYCVYPNYVEGVINMHELVDSSVVVGIDDPLRVQKIRAYIILKNGVKHTKELEDEIKSYCKKNIAKFSVPHEFEYIKEFPKTLVGKVSFKTLVTKDANIEVDPLLTDEEVKTQVKEFKLKEMLNIKKMVEKSMKVTLKYTNKALKRDFKEALKEQKNKIKENLNFTKKRGE